MDSENEAPKGTFRHGPYTSSRMLVPLEARAMMKLDEAAALLAEAAGLLIAASQDEQDGRTHVGGSGAIPTGGGVGGLAGRLYKEVQDAGTIVRECAAQIVGRK